MPLSICFLARQPICKLRIALAAFIRIGKFERRLGNAVRLGNAPGGPAIQLALAFPEARREHASPSAGIDRAVMLSGHVRWLGFGGGFAAPCRYNKANIEHEVRTSQSEPLRVARHAPRATNDRSSVISAFSLRCRPSPLYARSCIQRARSRRFPLLALPFY
jgi:hypothetical protein